MGSGSGIFCSSFILLFLHPGLALKGARAGPFLPWRLRKGGPASADQRAVCGDIGGGGRREKLGEREKLLFLLLPREECSFSASLWPSH